MRTLLLMRGAQGSGKNYWIKENRLEPYTLEADLFRTQICNPILDLEGNFFISQKNDRIAWNMLLKCLEERMKRGDFTIINATHSTQKMLNNYKAMAEMYKYTIFVKQLDVPLETCLERNRTRDKYKFVPEDAIKRCHTLISQTELSKGVKKIDKIEDINNFYVDNITDKYNRVIVVGDIHSCNTVLGQMFDKEEFREDTLYVFLGDYLDRGVEHKETLKRMMYLSTLKNVILLEGNHSWECFYGQGREIKSKKFLNETLPILIDGLNDEELEQLKSKLRQFYKKQRQAYAFEFDNKKYLCTHAGLPSVPLMSYIATDDMIKGIGDYEDDISGIYENNYALGKCQDFTQIFGHRANKCTEHSINLEGQVEFGGNLMYYVLEKGKEPRLESIKNEVYDKEYFNREREKYNRTESKNLTQNEEVNKLILSKLVKVKQCEPNLLSLNFGDNVFRKKQWNDITVKARGLFVDKETGNVSIRSYNKFFNYGELKETRDEYLMKNLQYPLIAKYKENGFLGLMSVVNGEVVLATKSTTQGDYKEYFQELWNRENSNIKMYLQEFASKENCTFIFEVKSFKDKHIIDFNKEELVLLDVVKNSLEVNGINIDTNYSSKCLNEFYNYVRALDCKIIRVVDTYAILDDFEHFKELLQTFKYNAFEGFVFTDQNGFMFKWKSDYYLKWKSVRYCYQYYLKHWQEAFPFRICKDSFEINFMKWVTEQDINWLKSVNYVDVINEYKNNIGS